MMNIKTTCENIQTVINSYLHYQLGSPPSKRIFPPPPPHAKELKALRKNLNYIVKKNKAGKTRIPDLIKELIEKLKPIVNEEPWGKAHGAAHVQAVIVEMYQAAQQELGRPQTPPIIIPRHLIS